LVGDNGAGKSTLVSILSGLVQPDTGENEVGGERVWIDSPHRAHELGIATVFQDLALVNQRDVAANVFLGREPVRFGIVVDRRRMLRDATSVITRLCVELPSVRAPSK
jgi:ABC-type sugar transport system ATPase subunit